jgi:hypothetical protein
VDVSGIRFVHREAGPVDAPVPLHGFQIRHGVAVVGEKFASDGEGERSLYPQRPQRSVLSMRVSIMATTYYRTVDVSGIRFVHREAGRRVHARRHLDAEC